MLKSTSFRRKEIPKEIKTRVYQKVVRPSLIYGSESWMLSEMNYSKVKEMEMRFLRRIKGITRMDRIRNTVVVEELTIVPIENVIEQSQSSLLYKMNEERLAKEIFDVRVPGKNKVRRSPKKMDRTS